MGTDMNMGNNSYNRNSGYSGFREGASGYTGFREGASGYLGRKDRALLFRFRERNQDVSDYEAEPGEVAAISGFDLSLDDWIRKHIDGNCDDAAIPQPPVETIFPSIRLPDIQFAAVRSSLEGYNVLADNYPSLRVTVPCEEDRHGAFESFISGGGWLTDAEFDKIISATHTALKEFAAKVTDKRAFTEPFTLYYSLRLKNGERCLASAPVTVRGNENRWKVVFTGVSFSNNTAILNTRLYRRPLKLALSLPDSEGNSKWINFISDHLWKDRIECIDIFAAGTDEAYPAVSTGKATRITPGEEPCPATLKDGHLSFSSKNEEDLKPGILYSSDNAAVTRKLFDPEGYTLIGSIPVDSLPETGIWILPDIAIKTIYDSKRAINRPDYLSARPGKGYVMLTASGCDIMTDISKGFGDATPALLSSCVNSKYGLWPEPDMDTGIKIYIGIPHNGTTGYIEQPDSEGWGTDGTGPDSLFHKVDDVIEIVVEDCINNRHRIYRMEKLTCGGSRWSMEQAGSQPDWKDGLFTAGTIICNTDEYYEKEKGTLYCSATETAGWYPEECRSVFAGYDGDIRCIIRFTGSGTGGKNSLLAFTDEGIWRLEHEEFSRNGIERQCWRPVELISNFTTFSHATATAIPKGVIFICESGVMCQQGKNTLRISSRGKSFVPENILLYHREANLLETRIYDEDGGYITTWWYDLEEEKEPDITDENPFDIIGDISTSIIEESHRNMDYKIVTRPFRIKQNSSSPLTPRRIRIASTQGIGNYDGSRRGIIAVQYSRDLHNWHSTSQAGLEAESPLPEAAAMKTGSANLWWRIGAAVPKEWGTPTGIEIMVVDNM